MLFQQRFLDGIAEGTVTLAYRRWRRPSVRAGGSLRTPVGVISIDSVEGVDPASITSADANRAGYASVEELVQSLAPGAYLPVYRIAFRYAGEDPRIRLRQNVEFSPDEAERIALKLARLDRGEPWTHRVLRLILSNPATRAADLAAVLDMDLFVLKTRVRKLKELGLTESLEIGYRISPRGEAWLSRETGEQPA